MSFFRGTGYGGNDPRVAIDTVHLDGPVAGVQLPPYYLEYWSGRMDPGVSSVWIRLAGSVLGARMAGYSEVEHVIVTHRELAPLMGVRSPSAVRSRLLDPAKAGGIAALFVRVGSVDELAVDDGLRQNAGHLLTPTLVVPGAPGEDSIPVEAVRRLRGYMPEAAAENLDPAAWLRTRVLPALARSGERSPEAALEVPSLRRPILEAYEELGTERAERVLKRVESSLGSVDKPISYLAQALLREAGLAASRTLPRPPQRAATGPDPSLGRGESGAADDTSLAEVLRSFLQDLENDPSRLTVTMARALIASAAPAGAEEVALVARIRDLVENLTPDPGEAEGSN